MVDPTTLLQRLDDIGGALRARGDALALVALGSVGAETARLDRFSDLDFFAIVQPGAKARYIARLDWLAAAHPLAWHFQNTVDGDKALMADGVFCEFAVFEPQELAAIPFALDRLLELDALRHPEAALGADPFNRERRLEARRPALAAELPGLVPGYEATPAAALALLAALARRGAVLNPAIVAHIEKLAG